MISAILYREGGRLTGYRASGHSGYAAEGADIVCAAVSVLGCTCVNAMESLCGIQAVIGENRDGLLSFDLPELPEKQDEKAQLLMGSLKQGLTDVQEAYPAYLRVTIKERRKQP